MPGMDGLALLREIQRLRPDLTVIVMSAYGAHDAAIEAMKAGAYDYLSKPFQPDEVVLVLRKAEERERLARENRRLRTELAGEYGPGEPRRRLGADAGGAAPAPQARAAEDHGAPAGRVGDRQGARRARAPRALAARGAPVRGGELRRDPGRAPRVRAVRPRPGRVHRRARARRRGSLEEADGGTLFLDEVGELPLPMQVKLLRFLQEEEVRPVGDVRARKVDVRVVAATARDLAPRRRRRAVPRGPLYRLDVVAVRLPPLRERGAGRRAARGATSSRGTRGSAPSSRRCGSRDEAREALLAHRWPGNVRELEHALERAVVLADGPLIREEDLPDTVRAPAPRRAAAPAPDGTLSVKRATRALEEQLIRAALERTGGNRTRAAELLELSYRALLYKIKDYGISLTRSRQAHNDASFRFSDASLSYNSRYRRRPAFLIRSGAIA